MGIVGTLQDITGRKAGEEERAQLIREQAARAEAESARRQAAFLAEVGATLASSLDDRAGKNPAIDARPPGLGVALDEA